MCSTLWKGIPIVFVCATIVAHAQGTADQSALIQQLTAKLAELEKRVAYLEGRKPDEPAAAAPPATVTTAAPAAPAHGPGHDMQPDPPALQSYPALKISGFSDLNFSATDQKGVRSGFN